MDSKNQFYLIEVKNIVVAVRGGGRKEMREESGLLSMCTML